MPKQHSVDIRGFALAALRIALALLVLGHPVQKFAGFPNVSQFGLAEPFSLIGTAGMIEAVTGLLLLIGLYTRPAAFILSGLMAAAYWLAHGSRGFFPIANGGELAIMFCFVSLFLSASHHDPLTLDAFKSRKRGRLD